MRPIDRKAARAAPIATLMVALLLSGCAARQYEQATCEGSYQSIMLLQAQAVPSARLLPCLRTPPEGWSYGGSLVRSGSARFWLDVVPVDVHAIEVTLTRSCDLSGATRASPSLGEPSVRRYEERAIEGPLHAPTQYYVFPGGCVTYRFAPSLGTSQTLVYQADRALAFVPRAALVGALRRDAGLILCGAGAPPCPG